VLAELALDLRWTWSHAGDDLWRMINAEVWERTRNPWTLLQDVSRERLETLARDRVFQEELRKLIGLRERYLSQPSWYAQHYSAGELERIAYFSMEFGLGESLPLYAGGLGILAGDYLKTASDLGVPAVGVGLLYQVGYFRQMVDAGGLAARDVPVQRAGQPAHPACRGAGRQMVACLARFSRADDPPARVARSGGARGAIPAG